MTRRGIAVAVIAVWVAGLALLYRRITNRTPDEALAEAGLRVSPATYYYMLEQDARQVGVASSAIDTTKLRIVATDFVRGVIPVGPDLLRVEARSEARFSRGLRLRDFIMRAEGDLAGFTLRGVMQEGEEKTLRLTTEQQGEDPMTLESVAQLPVFVPTVAPLSLMLRRPPRVGDSTRVAMFDPLSRGMREVTLHVQADSLFLIADSAAWDATTKRWVKARQDSIRGWRIGAKSAPLITWVDASGRLLAASEPGGISLLRTAFELAFENWRIDNPATGRVPGGLPTTAPTRHRVTP